MVVYRPTSTRTSPWWWGFATFISLMMLFPGWATARTVWGGLTMKYELTDQAVVIQYGPAQQVIERDSVEETTVVKTTDGTRRNGTSIGGLKEGRWSFPETGPITLYAAGTQPLVVISTPDAKYGITPASPDQFLGALEGGGTGSFEPAARPSMASLIVLALAGGLVPVGVIWMLLYLGKVGATIEYRLLERELEIKIGFSRVKVPYATILGARIANPDGWPLRLFGAGMPGLHWGAFRWKPAGKQLSMYTTRIKPLVLVTTEKKTYGLTPADDEGFVAELKRRVGL